MAEPVTQAGRGGGLRVTPWNLLLLLPFLMLITPLFNSVEPRLFGMPFFYWIQFAFVPVGVACVAAVYMRTRGEVDPVAGGEPPDVDELDEGTAGRAARRSGRGRIQTAPPRQAGTAATAAPQDEHRS